MSNHAETKNLTQQDATMPAPAPKNFDSFVKLFVNLLKRRRRLFWTVFALAMIGVIAGAYVKRPYYESSASILVTLDTPSVSSSGSEVRRVVASLEADEVIASQVELIKTRQLAEELVDVLPESVFTKKPSDKWYIRLVSGTVATLTNAARGALERLLLVEKTSERYKRVRFVEKGLNVFAIRRAQMLIVSFQSKDPEDPQVVLNGLIDLYTRKVTELRNKAEGYQLYTRQATRLSEELSAAEKSLSAFMIEHKVLDFDTERQRLLARVNSLSAVVDALANAGADINPGDARYFVTGPDAPPQIVQMMASLNNLIVERARLKVSFASTHPDVQRLQTQIDTIRAELQREMERLATVKKLDRERLQAMLDIAPEYNRLFRSVRILTDAYEVYRKAASDQETTAERDQKVLTQVVDPPNKTYTPLPPNRLMLILAGLVFSLVLALAIVTLTEWISSVYPAGKQAEAAA